MEGIPYPELALGAARNQAFAEGVAAGVGAGRLWARKQDAKHDNNQHLAGWAARTAGTRQPGWSLWDPSSSAMPDTMNFAQAYNRLVRHTADEESVATQLGVDLSSAATRDASVRAIAKGATEKFKRMLRRAEAGQTEAFKLDVVTGGVSTTIGGQALVFQNRAGARLFLARDVSVMPAVVEETPGVSRLSPIQGRLRPAPRSPYDEARATTYLSASGSGSDSGPPDKRTSPADLQRLFRTSLSPADAAGLAADLEEIDGEPPAANPRRSARERRPTDPSKQNTR